MNTIWVHEKEAKLWEEMNKNLPQMSFDEVLEKLGISEYKNRILNSNSHGELFHIRDYYVLTTVIGAITKGEFAAWFKDVVEWAEKNWDRPESVFQHILRTFNEHLHEAAATKSKGGGNQ